MDARAITPFQMIGGEGVVAAIVERFYDLMENDPAYADLRALHAEDLSPVRQGLTSFLNGWLGGPRDWFGQGRCVMSLHGAIAIPPHVAWQWSDAMTRAIAGQDDADPRLAKAMIERLGEMAQAMVNRS